MHAAPRRTGLGLVLLCLSGSLIVGFVLKQPCASGEWQDGRQYRQLCYSDIVPLYTSEQLAGGRLPYLDSCRPSAYQCDEYPVVTMYVMRVAAWLVPGGQGPSPPVTDVDFSTFFAANATVIAAAAFVTVIATYAVVGRRALYVALAPTLLIYAFVNWDMIAVMFATLGVVAYLRRRNVRAGAFLGLGTAAKLFPGLLAIPLVLGRLRERDPDGAIYLSWATLGSWLVVNLPFALAGFAGWSTFFRFNATRSPDYDSLWYIGCRTLTGNTYCTHVQAIGLASFLVFAGGSVLVWRLKASRYPDFPAWTFGFPLLVVFLLSNKVYSPQYGLWLLPWFAWTLPDLRVFAAFEIADVGVFVTRFAWFGHLDPHIGGWVDGVTYTMFEVTVLVRAAVLVWAVVAWVRRQPERLPLTEAEPAVALADA
ncbi:MAG: glycosyltransferase family 87 protein [Actinomycetota bacterium]